MKVTIKNTRTLLQREPSNEVKKTPFTPHTLLSRYLTQTIDLIAVLIMEARNTHHRLSPCRDRGTGDSFHQPFVDMFILTRECHIPRTRRQRVARANEDSYNCNICHDSTAIEGQPPAEDLVRLPCCHQFFGTDCLVTWLTDPTSQGRCPCCRRLVLSTAKQEGARIYRRFRDAIVRFTNGDDSALEEFRGEYPQLASSEVPALQEAFRNLIRHIIDEVLPATITEAERLVGRAREVAER